MVSKYSDIMLEKLYCMCGGPYRKIPFEENTNKGIVNNKISFLLMAVPNLNSNFYHLGAHLKMNPVYKQRNPVFLR